MSCFGPAVRSIHLHDTVVIITLIARHLTENLLGPGLLSQNKTIFGLGFENEAILAAFPFGGGMTHIAFVEFPAVYVVLDRRLRSAKQRTRLFVNRDAMPLHKVEQVFWKNTPLTVRGKSVAWELLAFKPPLNRVVGTLADVRNIPCGKNLLMLHGLVIHMKLQMYIFLRYLSVVYAFCVFRVLSQGLTPLSRKIFQLP